MRFDAGPLRDKKMDDITLPAKLIKKKGGARPGAGRPYALIDWKLVDQLCHIQCTQDEILSFVDVDQKTLYAACKREHLIEFSSYFTKKAAGGKASLRRSQWKNACENDNPTIQIWLGKQYLKQTDKIEQSIDHTTTALTPDERAKLKHQQKLAALGAIDTDDDIEDV